MSLSKRPKSVPSYRLHEPSGQARVIIDGEHIYYLGVYGSPESQEKYARLLAKLAVTRQNGNGQKDKAESSLPHPTDPDLLVCQLVRQYHEFAKGYFVRDSEAGKECVEIKLAVRPLLKLYGTEIRKQHGLEAAQVALGHKNANITEVYAERNLALAVQITKESG